MKKLILLVLFVICSAIAFVLYVDLNAPEISWDVASNDSINRAVQLTVVDDVGVSEVCYTLSGGACTDQVKCMSDIAEQQINISIDPEQCAVSAEPFPLKISVDVVDTSLLKNKAAAAVELTYDAQAPNVSVVKGTRSMRQGGAGVVVYQVGETPYETGVVLGELKFRAYEIAPDQYLSFYAHPYNVSPDDFKPRILVADAAGNLRKIRPGSKTRARAYRSEEIKLTDEFLEVVKDKMRPSAPESPLEVFKSINNDMRQENYRTIAQACETTEKAKFWDGVFLRNQGATKARFADSRTYTYQGQTVSEQVHTGSDIAGLNNLPIVAANHGKVVFTGEIGIYGNVVIIDHGYGVHTLYGHLSRIDVEVGESVRKGDTIALSGETGLAFGDHLHFEVRVSGVPVDPIEWFDPAWIASSIEPFMPEASD